MNEEQLKKIIKEIENIFIKNTLKNTEGISVLLTIVSYKLVEFGLDDGEIDHYCDFLAISAKNLKLEMEGDNE